MQYALLVVVSWVSGDFNTPAPESISPMQAVLTTVLKSPSLAPFLSHYLCRQPVYYRFRLVSPPDASILQRLDRLTLQVRHCPPLVHNTLLDARRHPVVVVRVLQVVRATARVQIELPIEGVSGNFTLLKGAVWTIHTQKVSER